MNKLRKLSDEKPILYCLLTMACFIAILTAARMLLSLTHLAPDTYLQYVIAEVVAVAVGIVFMNGAGQEYVRKCGMRGFGTGIVAGIFFLIFGSYSFLVTGSMCLSWEELGETAETMKAAGVDFTGYEPQSGICILLFVLLMILVGLAEEFAFRGVIAERLLRHFGKDAKGVKKAVLISGLLFGAMHLFNGFATGLTACLIQAVVTSAMGMIFVLVYYKSGNIYAAAFLHSFIDFCGLAWRNGFYAPANAAGDISSAMQYSAATLGQLIPYAIVVLVLMRKKNIGKILTRIHPESVSQ